MNVPLFREGETMKWMPWAAALGAAATTALVLVTSSPATDQPARAPAKPARNVIFIQGDGMGTAQRDAIRLATVGPRDDLVMDQLPVAGLVHTDPDDPEDTVTDSAAAATAFATGVKSYNGAIGVGPNGERLTTILERAREAGKATGLVTTSQVTDASPAAFAAHVANRAQQSEIARQYLTDSRPDVILGGGEDRWFPPGEPGAYPDDEEAGDVSRSDRGNLVEQAREAGYEYVSDRAGLRRARSGRLLGLFANEEMFNQAPEGEGDVYDPVVPLPEMTRKALDVVSRDRDGFFLFVEEEAIDEMAHENNARLMIKAGQQLDRTVQVALNFAASHPGTLILVAGDHETGGLTIEDEDAEDESGDGLSAEDGPFPVADTDRTMVADWTTGQHTGADTPITAAGRGSRAFDGVIDNTDVHDGTARAFGFDEER
jgi:alkaline phosphatase